MLYKARSSVIEFYDNYSSISSKAKKKSRKKSAKATKETKTSDKKEQEAAGLTILTPKQMLQRLPIALAEVKVCHNSESLLNEIRQIVYSLYTIA